MKSPSDRAMLGKNNIPKLERWLAKEGLTMLYEATEETFTFGNSSSPQVRRVDFIPLAIAGRAGEFRIHFIP